MKWLDTGKYTIIICGGSVILPFTLKALSFTSFDWLFIFQIWLTSSLFVFHLLECKKQKPHPWNKFLTRPNSLSVSTSKMVGEHSFLKQYRRSRLKIGLQASREERRLSSHTLSSSPPGHASCTDCQDLHIFIHPDQSLHCVGIQWGIQYS